MCYSVASAVSIVCLWAWLAMLGEDRGLAMPVEVG